MTTVVWVLIYSVIGGTSVQIGTVDNIASKQNCEALAHVINSRIYSGRWSCIAVRKVSP